MGLTLKLKRTRRASKGLRRPAPGTSRAPLLWLAVMGMAGAALHASDWELAVLLVPQFVSKTKQFDESVLVDWENIAGPRHALERLRNARRGEELLWHTSQAEYSKKFKHYAEMSEVHILGAHLYSVRHRGASLDALNAKRPMPGSERSL